MSVLLATALSAASATLPSCSWDRPGAFPFSGDVVAAVDRYTDIPAPVRAALKRRMEQRQYDEVAIIGRNSITGKARYSPEIRDMHFASGTVCRTVTRTRWKADAEERGLVYCEAEHCIIVPTVCRNVSRVTRLQKAPATAAAPPAPVLAQGGAPGGEGANGETSTRSKMAASAAAPEAPLQASELQFEAPAAGPSFAALADPTTLAAPSAPSYTGGGASAGPGLPLFGFSGTSLGGGGAVPAPAPAAGGDPGSGTGIGSIATPPSGGGGGVNPVAPAAPDAPVTPIAPGSPATPPAGVTETPVVVDPPALIVPAPPVVLPQVPGTVLPEVLSPVPEPSSWAAMLLGLLGVATAARRGRRNAAQKR